LPTEIPVAIPHTDPEHFIHPALVFGVFNDPVPFGQMGAESTTVMAQMVFLLAIGDPKSQAAWLASSSSPASSPGWPPQDRRRRLCRFSARVWWPLKRRSDGNRASCAAKAHFQC
jgi:hypothetical protein